MKTAIYLIILTATVAILALGTSIVSARSQPWQYGGGYLHGWVYGFSYDNYLLPISWANVTATNGPSVFHAASGVNGGYEMFIPVGNYNVTVTEPGYVSYSTSVSVSGGSSSVINFYLEESHVPIPEFQSELVSVVLVLSLIAVLLRKKSAIRTD
ncbi:MAG: carboxypeptidase regulatory-like domain-containing protein [Candidatus Bathyarchaeia archaeon]